MGTFDAFADTPNQIHIEGQEITLRFDRTSATTGRISWNIPQPAAGCSSENQAYCGMLLTVDTVGADRDTMKPRDGSMYVGDPTADSDLHMGSKLGTALVVGAFYEAVKKGTNQEFTTHLDITGLTENVPVYVNGYAVDCQNRYHTDGVYSYSLEKCLQVTADTSGSVSVTFHEDFIGTDGTGLKLGRDYSVLMEVDGNEFTIVVNGTDAQTYDDMVEAINNELELQTEAPQSTVPPNTNSYYYDTDNGKLFQWDGDSYVEIEVLNEPTDPTATAVGDYWYDTDDSILYQWDGAAWVLIPSTNIITYLKDPTDVDALASSDYWYRPEAGSPDVDSAAFKWSGNVWCEQTLFDQATDPTSGITPTAGDYWYNPDDMLLRNWNEELCTWVETDALYWNEDPTALSPDTYWFNDSDSTLWQLDTPDVGIWNPLGKTYIDFTLDLTNVLTDVGLAVREDDYRDTVTIAGQVIDLVVSVCNDTESTFESVFADINKQLDGLATIDFRGATTPEAVRLLGADESSIVISAGGDLFSSFTNYIETLPVVTGLLLTVGDEPTTPVANQYWVNNDSEVFQRDAGNTTWETLCAIVFDTDPTDVESCDLWWDSDTDVLNIWDVVTSDWTPVENFVQSTADPTASVEMTLGDVWYDGTDMSVWDGNLWEAVTFMVFGSDPTTPATGVVWYNDVTNEWSERNATPAWDAFDPVDSPGDPSQATMPSGTFWYDTQNLDLSMWNGANWVNVIYGTESVEPDEGDLWYDLSTLTLMEWDGTTWVEGTPIAEAVISTDNTIVTTSSSTGNESIVDMARNSDENELVWAFSPTPDIGCAMMGTEGLSCIPSTEQVGVGTDGSADERREMIDEIRIQLGYPVVDVELTKAQFDKSIDMALKELRRHSAAAYRRGFMKLFTTSGKQIYKLTKTSSEYDGQGQGYDLADGVYGFDKVVQVMGLFRITSAFLTAAHGSGIFGQVVLQHLYNMGTFDLLSFHLVSEYIEQLEHLFASRLTFNWNESARSLTIHQPFPYPETILMDVAVERTEQDLLTDRFTGRWLEKYALAHCKKMLAQIRGKFASLPGAGGGVSLNASDLNQEANDEFEQLQAEIDNYIVNNVEEYGMHVEFIIG